MEEIVIDISADGKEVKVEGVGIQGPDCKALTKEIEDALGPVAKTIKKAEFNRPPAIRRKASL